MNSNEKDCLQIPFSEDARKDFNRAYIELGGQGERVLGFADLRLNKEQFPRGFQFNTDEAKHWNLTENAFSNQTSQ